MAEDLPGPPGSGSRDDRPGGPPTDRPDDSTRPIEPGPAYGPPDASQQPRGYGPPTADPRYAQQYGYGQPGYGYPPAPQTEAMATAALVVAIVGFFVCFPVGGIVALILADNAIRNIEASGGRLTGLEQAQAARIIAIVELVLAAIIVLLIVIAGAIAVSVSGGTDEPVQPVPTVPGIVGAARLR